MLIFTILTLRRHLFVRFLSDDPQEPQVQRGEDPQGSLSLLQNFFFFLKTNRRPGYAEGLFFTQRLWNLFHGRSPVRPGYVWRLGYGGCRSGYGVLNCTLGRSGCHNRVPYCTIQYRQCGWLSIILDVTVVAIVWFYPNVADKNILDRC